MNGDLVLRLFWWLALGALVAGIGIFLGGQLGLSVLLRYLGRNETERRVLIERAGRPADGHQVWFVLGGGAVAGAWWPLISTTLFSGLWLVLLFLGIALLGGPLGQGFRERIDASRRASWDLLWALLALASLLVLGIGVGATVSGGSFQLDAHLNASWGGFASRFSPYEVLVPGVLAVAAGVWLAAARVAVRCDGVVAARARGLLLPAGGLVLLAFIGGALWATQLPGYAVAGVPALGTSAHNGSAFAVPGAYLEQFLSHLPLVIVPVIAGLALVGALFFAWRGAIARVWPLAAAAVAGIVATAGAMTYPVIVPSSTHPAQSLTVWNAAAQPPVLISLLVWLGLLIPAVAAYEIWLRNRGRGRSAVGNSAG